MFEPVLDKVSAEVIKNALGKKIASAALVENRLILKFEEGSSIQLFDDGQFSCETRYMVCDDDLSAFKGAALWSLELAEAPPDEMEGDVHEVQFLRIGTSLGTIVCSNHNEHNGNYGGIDLVVQNVEE